MDLTSDYPYWSIRNGLPACFPTLDRDLTCDAAIIGGGITGALVAYYFSRGGIDTVLLDKREIGTGSTSGSTGLLQYEVDVPLRQLVETIGKKDAFRSYELCARAVTELGRLIHRLKIECGFEFKTSLFLARRSDEIPDLQEELRLRREMGLDVEWWSRGQIERRFPFSRPAALFSQLGGQVDPHHLTHGLLQAGKRHGLKVFDRSAAGRIQPTSRGVQFQACGKFTVRARRVIVACGFESGRYLPRPAGTLKSTYAVISEPMRIAGWYRRSLIWETGSPYLYLRTTPDHRVIIGGEDVDVVSPHPRDKLLPRKTAVLVRKFARLFPDLKFEPAYSWAGTFGGTKDGLAYIGSHPGLKHTYFALGFGGNGITYSLIAAGIIRDHFLGRANRDSHLFRFDR